MSRFSWNLRWRSPAQLLPCGRCWASAKTLNEKGTAVNKKYQKKMVFPGPDRPRPVWGGPGHQRCPPGLVAAIGAHVAGCDVAALRTHCSRKKIRTLGN